MVALCVESLDRVGCVVDDLQLALLVVVPVSAVQHAVSVSLLVAELTVISSAGVITKSVAMRSSLAMDLESHLLRLRISLRLKACGSGVDSRLEIPLLGGDGDGLAEVAIHVQPLICDPDPGPLVSSALSLGPGRVLGLWFPLVHGLGFLVVVVEVILEHFGLRSVVLELTSLGSLGEDRDRLLLWPHRGSLGRGGPESPVLSRGPLPPLK